MLKDLKKKRKLIFIGGEASIGKSTLSNIISKIIEPSIVIDKDEVTYLMSEHILKEKGHSINDRESKFYKEVVRPLEYKMLDSILWSLSNKDVSIFINAPYLEEFKNKEWIDNMSLMATVNNLDVSFIFLTADTDKIKKRMFERNANRDEYKIKNYKAYRFEANIINKSILNTGIVKHLHLDDSIKDIENLLGMIE